VWRKQVNNKAANLGYKGLNSPMGEDDDSEKLDGDGPGAFAYSPLPATEYQDANDSTYPGGGSATYTGETVALQPDGDGAVIYTGLIEVTATWHDMWRDAATDETPAEGAEPTAYNVGKVTALISDLETPEGDSLQYITITEAEIEDDPKTRDVVEAGMELDEDGVDIQQIIFREVNIMTPEDEEENTLTFNTDFTIPDGGSAGDEDGMARIVTSLGDNPMDVLVAEADRAASLVGTFVGQDVDGPLGVIGRWTLMDSSNAKQMLTTSPGIERQRDDTTGKITHTKTYETNASGGTFDAADGFKIGTGAMIYGAFGAEVEP
jgi:hypothetical protein